MHFVQGLEHNDFVTIYTGSLGRTYAH